MTAYGVSSMFFHEYTSEEIFSFVARAGLDGIEYWLETPHFWLRDLPADEVIACRRAHPEIATLTVHTPVLDHAPIIMLFAVFETCALFEKHAAGHYA